MRRFSKVRVTLSAAAFLLAAMVIAIGTLLPRASAQTEQTYVLTSPGWGSAQSAAVAAAGSLIRAGALRSTHARSRDTIAVSPAWRMYSDHTRSRSTIDMRSSHCISRSAE